MSRFNFRIKIDLCKYYNDVRRYCWIFIDGTKMLQIAHLMEHITKLFSIKEPFHLLLNETDYLPPNEDIRILKENETILVSPGSGLNNDTTINNVILSESRYRQEVENTPVKQERIGNSVQHKQMQTNFPIAVSSPARETLPTDTANKSGNDVSEVSIMSCEGEDSEVNSIADSKTADLSLASDRSTIIENITCSKRKRVRHRKKKQQQEMEPPLKKKEETNLKPKIINSCVVSTGKHIRFNNVDTEGAEEVQSDTIDRPASLSTAISKLANLLALGESPAPLTFSNTRIKQEVKTERTSDEEAVRFNPSSENTNESTAVINNNILTPTEIEQYPPMTTKPQLKDVIAFKMLKIGSDYSPQISNYIVADVISYCPKSSMYTLKVSQGISEVQVPVGKFTIIENEEEQELKDTITLNYVQIMEPRLISRSHTSNVASPVNCTE
ncbi:uncharacterized protein LOC108626253 [Ceratina calcarata]|uniref:Uncharacterized protein LOC108626253 n=1 Tax=Ceratina calcarata TaxID=156304 RepID=A0AAJ7J269_9HYME|nr:uncharacterized protein LOC108626253 [Ceratina calcarata]